MPCHHVPDPARRTRRAGVLSLAYFPTPFTVTGRCVAWTSCCRTSRNFPSDVVHQNEDEVRRGSRCPLLSHAHSFRMANLPSGAGGQFISCPRLGRSDPFATPSDNEGGRRPERRQPAKMIVVKPHLKGSRPWASLSGICRLSRGLVSIWRRDTSLTCPRPRCGLPPALPRRPAT